MNKTSKIRSSFIFLSLEEFLPSRLLQHRLLKREKKGCCTLSLEDVIGAMDLFYRGIKHFCLVAGDSDYVPLVQRLRQDGYTVLIIGTPTMSSALKEASNLFVSTDHLLPQAASAPPVPSSVSASPALISPSTAELSTLLTDAYTLVAQKSGTEWVLLSASGATLRQCNPDFAILYGKQSLSKLVKQYAHCFEIHKRKIGKGEVEEVRLRST